MIQYALNIYCILHSIQGVLMLSWFTIKDLLKPKFFFLTIWPKFQFCIYGNILLIPSTLIVFKCFKASKNIISSNTLCV